MRTLNGVLTAAILVSVLILIYSPETAGTWFAYARLGYVKFALGL